MKYFQSKLAGYVGIAMAVLGGLIQYAPIILPFVSPKVAANIGVVVQYAGLAKTWLAASPIAKA